MGEGAQQRVAAGEYAAFISYSHADTAAAARIHRALESYRLPRRIARGAASADTPPPERLFPIFRDREELSAGSDLSAQVTAALAASRALIVLCSPRAAQSRWVGLEIETFCRLYPDRPVVAALIDGEPDEAFPPALTTDGTQEPVAADFRPGGDGFALARLKLVAGLAGVPLDSLVQRDAQRRMRRVMAVTLVALAAMLVMAGLLVAALRAQAEARRQREEAEGMVEYMLTDLRDRLKGVGRLDVMTAVNERALAYYGGREDLSDLPDESLERRARILHAMGEDDDKRGDLDKALAKLREAHRTTAATLARAPNDPAAIFAHAQSEYWVGRVAERRGDWTEASARYQTYAALAGRLIALQPQNGAYMMEAGWGELNLGIVRLKSRAAPDFGDARFIAAGQWFERATRAVPAAAAALGELANAKAWLADARLSQKRLPESLAARREELTLREQLAAAAPGNADAAWKVAKARFSVAVNLTRLGRAGEARPLFETAVAELARLRQIDPSNRTWGVMFKRAESYLKTGSDIDGH